MDKTELTNTQKQERVRQRISRASIDPDKYEYIPAKEQNDHVKADEVQRVAIYARVSTDNPMQTSSFELQQKYYEELVGRYPKWVLVRIYADEGKSGTTMQHREAFKEMLKDANAGKIDLIIVKNISRFARNVVDCLSVIRKLSEKKVGVLFESEAIYSLNDDSHLALSFQATIAEQESRVRSRSMETSLRMRLDHGLPLTPKLLGFMHDENGKLVINPETYKTPKLMFYMYLYGYSTQQIADTLTRLSKRTYLGNLKWTASGVAATMRNERYCGDVLTRKRFTKFAVDVHDQKSFKNRGEKPQSHYLDDHEAIIDRNDFLAVQRIMNNAKFGGTSLLPELQVIPDGLLKGFVIVHPKWGSFTKEDYIRACESVDPAPSKEVRLEIEGGSFDLSGYEVADFKLFSDQRVPAIMLHRDNITFSVAGIRAMDFKDNFVELLVHPLRKEIAVRPTDKNNRCAIQWSSGIRGNRQSRQVAAKAYIQTMYQIFRWEPENHYKLYGRVYRDGQDAACIFAGTNASVYIKNDEVTVEDATGQQINRQGRRIRGVVGAFGQGVGNAYYVEKSMTELRNLTRQEWQTQLAGRMFSTDSALRVTPYEELRSFIQEELGELFEEEAQK
ncbi:MAG: recombinase family protein [Clostridiales bacterium]|nr:recombinase family protein [Clostridiales bacterium]